MNRGRKTIPNRAKGRRSTLRARPRALEQVMDDQKQEHLTVEEASAFFDGKISTGTLYRLARKGKVPSVKLGGKVLFRRSDLENMGREAPAVPQEPSQAVKPARKTTRPPKAGKRPWVFDKETGHFRPQE